MEDTNAGTDGTSRSAKSNQRVGISERKLKANRENANKSTGPRTTRGKAVSRQNAIKHGLFVNYVTDFEALNEDPEKFKKLLHGFRDQYQPVGRAEEVEVERIAICYWRLKRAWRYENAENLAARRNSCNPELDQERTFCDERSKAERAAIALLQRVIEQIKDTGQVSDELKQQIFAIMPELEALWSELDNHAKVRTEQVEVVEGSQTLSRLKDAWSRDMCTVTMMMALLEPLSGRRLTNVAETTVGLSAIPNSEALDRLLRYETTIERQLNRAIERLDRLQRHRRGEAVPPELRVHFA